MLPAPRAGPTRRRADYPASSFGETQRGLVPVGKEPSGLWGRVMQGAVAEHPIGFIHADYREPPRLSVALGG